MSTRDRGGGEPQLWVDEQVHATECRRFDASIAYGPTDADCDIWIKAIGGDGYGRNRAELHPVRLKATSC